MKPFIAADILLPAPQTDMGLWPALACDQFTSQPEYWQKAETLTQNAPSTLHITLPEAYLESPDVDGRIAAIHTAMADYRARVLTRGVHGFVYVERATQSGVRQGLVGAVDLEAYSYEKGSASQRKYHCGAYSAAPCRAPGRAAGNASYHDAAG